MWILGSEKLLSSTSQIQWLEFVMRLWRNSAVTQEVSFLSYLLSNLHVRLHCAHRELSHLPVLRYDISHRCTSDDLNGFEYRPEFPFNKVSIVLHAHKSVIYEGTVGNKWWNIAWFSVSQAIINSDFILYFRFQNETIMTIYYFFTETACFVTKANRYAAQCVWQNTIVHIWQLQRWQLI